MSEITIRQRHLVGLERKLQNELDEGPQIAPPENSGRRHPCAKMA